MEKPTSKPHYPYFSSGPCAKPPGWSLDKLQDAALSRSHRSGAAVKKNYKRSLINQEKYFKYLTIT